MALMKRARNDIDLPTWFGGRRFLDWPAPWSELLEESEIRVEEFTDDGQLVVRAEMPGIDPDKDVEITMSDNTLHLRAERRSEEKSDDKQGYRSEFRYGSFARSIRLPIGATESDVQATYTDGILEVRIPIDTEQSTARKIPIEHR